MNSFLEITSQLRESLEAMESTSQRTERLRRESHERELRRAMNAECAEALRELADAMTMSYPRYSVECALKAISKALELARQIDPEDDA